MARDMNSWRELPVVEEPPFKKGDWLVTRPDSFPNFIPYLLHQATEDPKMNIACGTHWSYRARTIFFEEGKTIREVDAAHFTKATKADLAAEQERITHEIYKLQERRKELKQAVEGLS